MTWKVDFSKEAFKFIKKQEITGKVIGEIKSFILKTKGEDINIDIKKLTGKWKDFYRIRKGKIRIIFTVNYESKRFYIEKVCIIRVNPCLNFFCLYPRQSASTAFIN